MRPICSEKKIERLAQPLGVRRGVEIAQRRRHAVDDLGDLVRQDRENFEARHVTPPDGWWFRRRRSP